MGKTLNIDHEVEDAIVKKQLHSEVAFVGGPVFPKCDESNIPENITPRNCWECLGPPLGWVVLLGGCAGHLACTSTLPSVSPGWWSGWRRQIAKRVGWWLGSGR